jgi:hypothetical protein
MASVCRKCPAAQIEEDHREMLLPLAYHADDQIAHDVARGASAVACAVTDACFR